MKKLVKAGLIIDNYELFENLYRTKIPGSFILSIRNKMTPIYKQIEEWNKLKEEYFKENIKTVNEKGILEPKKGTKEFSDLIEWSLEVLNGEVELEIIPLTEKEIELFEFSQEEFDILEYIGLIDNLQG